MSIFSFEGGNYYLPLTLAEVPLLSRGSSTYNSRAPTYSFPSFSPISIAFSAISIPPSSVSWAPMNPLACTKIQSLIPAFSDNSLFRSPLHSAGRAENNEINKKSKIQFSQEWGTHNKTTNSRNRGGLPNLLSKESSRAGTAWTRVFPCESGYNTYKKCFFSNRFLSFSISKRWDFQGKELRMTKIRSRFLL